MIQDFNGVPLYAGQCLDPNMFEGVQSEFRKIYEDLTDKDQFAKREEWDTFTHSLSDAHFNSNLLDEYDTTNFKEFLK